ncbi:13486_t:CDS:1, partial [Acaulospora morrowiae]
TFNIPNLSDVIETYDKYFSKRPLNADKEFYLQPIENIGQ